MNLVKPFVLERDGYKCVKCGTNDTLHVHHIVHRSDGGTNSINNLVTLCQNCHAECHKNEIIYRVMIKNVKTSGAL